MPPLRHYFRCRALPIAFSMPPAADTDACRLSLPLYFATPPLSPVFFECRFDFHVAPFSPRLFHFEDADFAMPSLLMPIIAVAEGNGAPIAAYADFSFSIITPWHTRSICWPLAGGCECLNVVAAQADNADFRCCCCRHCCARLFLATLRRIFCHARCFFHAMLLPASRRFRLIMPMDAAAAAAPPPDYASAAITLFFLLAAMLIFSHCFAMLRCIFAAVAARFDVTLCCRYAADFASSHRSR